MNRIAIFLIICLNSFALSSCYFDLTSNSSMDNSNYSESLEIKNGLNECYIVEYEERNGFPDKRMKVNISESKQLIASYWSEFSDANIPNEMLCLFTYENCEYYYIANQISSFIVVNDRNDSEFKSPISLSVDFSEIKSIDKYIELSSCIRDNISVEELEEKFQVCSYDSTDIVSLYALSE